MLQGQKISKVLYLSHSGYTVTYINRNINKYLVNVSNCSIYLFIYLFIHYLCIYLYIFLFMYQYFSMVYDIIVAISTGVKFYRVSRVSFDQSVSYELCDALCILRPSVL